MASKPAPRAPKARTSLPSPLPTIFIEGYMSVELMPEGYKTKPYRVIIVRCLASDCDRQFDTDLKYITSTGNWWKHIQDKHPELIKDQSIIYPLLYYINANNNSS